MKSIYILLISLTLNACNNDDPVDQESQLPPITMTGENTFGCLVDGTYFRPRDGRSTINSDNKGLRVLQTETNNWEIHVFDRKSNRGGSLYIHIEDYFINYVSIYQINSANGLRGIDGPDNTYVYGRFFNDETKRYENYHSFNNSGLIEITEDNHNPGVHYIISGVFKADLVNLESTSDTLKIEQGRFDIDSISLQSASFH